MFKERAGQLTRISRIARLGARRQSSGGGGMCEWVVCGGLLYSPRRDDDSRAARMQVLAATEIEQHIASDDEEARAYIYSGIHFAMRQSIEKEQRGWWWENTMISKTGKRYAHFPSRSSSPKKKIKKNVARASQTKIIIREKKWAPKILCVCVCVESSCARSARRKEIGLNSHETRARLYSPNNAPHFLRARQQTQRINLTNNIPFYT